MGKELIKRQNFNLSDFFFRINFSIVLFVRMYTQPLFAYTMFDRLEFEILRLAKKISKCAITFLPPWERTRKFRKGWPKDLPAI